MGKFLNKYYKDLKDHDDEKFKFVTYPNVVKNTYVISNYGKLINFKTDKVHKPYPDKDGYLKGNIQRTKEGLAGKIFIHRLVCWEYCKHKEGCTVVNHKDGNKNNNYYKNLEWTTVKGNTQHAIKMGLTVRAGSGANNAKYPQETIEKICELLQDGNSAYEVIQYFYPGSKWEDHESFGMLIRRIRDGKAHVPTSKKYKFPKEAFSSNKERWKEKDIDKISSMIKSGKTNKEIMKSYGFNEYRDVGAHRITDKIGELRETLGIKNPNPYAIRREEIRNMVIKGYTNKQILEHYGLRVYRDKGASSIMQTTLECRREIEANKNNN